MTANTRKQLKMTTALVGILLSFALFGLGFFFVCSEDDAAAKRANQGRPGETSIRTPGKQQPGCPGG